MNITKLGSEYGKHYAVLDFLNKNSLVYSFGIGFVSITSFAAGFAQSYEQLLIFRAVGGFGSSMFSVAAGSILMRAVDDEAAAGNRGT